MAVVSVTQRKCNIHVLTTTILVLSFPSVCIKLCTFYFVLCHFKCKRYVSDQMFVICGPHFICSSWLEKYWFYCIRCVAFSVGLD